MANEQYLNIIGNMTEDPELRQTQNNTSVANFSIARTPRTYNRETRQWESGDPLFIRCTAWGVLADNIAKTLRKGDRVLAHGRLSQRKYTDSQGVTRNPIQLTVDEIGPSIRFATATVTKNGKGNASSGSSAWQRGQNYSASKPKANAYASKKDYSNGAGFGGDADPLGTGDKPAF